MDNKVEHIMPYGDKQGKTQQVQAMFDSIAPAYDFMNRAMTMGIDKWWRKVACTLVAAAHPAHILDVATGTGDFAVKLYDTIHPATLTGIDLSEGMLDVARRKVDPASLQPLDEIGETFSFPLQDGLVVEGGERFTLEPYDVVSVRKSPAFRRQSFVTVDGEVNFPGQYVLLTEGERASDLIKRAGGPTKQAFVRGGVLTRKLSEEEANVQNAIREMTRAGSTRDTLNIKLMRKGDPFTVGIELDKALEKPGSEFDPILREGDRIFVPEQLTTVRISGNVLYPNTVTYVPGKPVEYYVTAAGGYGFRAKRSKTYIVYLNGNVRRAGGLNAKIEPGCEIIVPEKPERKGVTTGEVMSMASSAASLTTVVITLVNLLSRNNNASK